MKRIVVILLLIGFFFQSTSQLWIVGSFFANRDYIARTSCENRDKPASGCNGACQLKKKIKEDQEQQEKKGPDAKQKEITLFFVSNFIKVYNTTLFTPELSGSYPLSNSTPIYAGYSRSVFHPPAALV